MMQRKDRAHAGGRGTRHPDGGETLKKVEMETVISCPRTNKPVPFDLLDRRIDRALAELHGELIAEPLSPSLSALAKRLTIRRFA